MYASEATAGESTRRHWIAGPAESTTRPADASRATSSCVGDTTVAVSVYAPSCSSWNRASEGDGTAGDDV
jgi:hypothetical protein